MAERPRLLVLDLLESYARERGVHVLLARMSERDGWTCVLTPEGAFTPVSGTGRSAREAIMSALRQQGVDVPA